MERPAGSAAAPCVFYGITSGCGRAVSYSNRESGNLGAAEKPSRSMGDNRAVQRRLGDGSRPQNCRGLIAGLRLCLPLSPSPYRGLIVLFPRRRPGSGLSSRRVPARAAPVVSVPDPREVRSGSAREPGPAGPLCPIVRSPTVPQPRRVLSTPPTPFPGWESPPRSRRGAGTHHHEESARGVRASRMSTKGRQIRGAAPAVRGNAPHSARPGATAIPGDASRRFGLSISLRGAVQTEK